VREGAAEVAGGSRSASCKQGGNAALTKAGRRPAEEPRDSEGARHVWVLPVGSLGGPRGRRARRRRLQSEGGGAEIWDQQHFRDRPIGRQAQRVAAECKRR